MKKKLLYLLPVLFLAVLAAGCFKTDLASPSVTADQPSGTFSGQFRLLHRSSDSLPFDTTACSLTVTINTNGTYAVTGDTSTIHAGSNGTYGISSPYISFADKTYPKTGTPVKTHLNGTYQYYYDGTVFQMLAYSSDTLSLQYDLKRAQ